MNEQDAGRIIITFNNLAKLAGLDPADKTSFGSAEKKEILAEVEKRLDDWVSGVGPLSGARAPALDPQFKADAPKILHGIFDKRGNLLGLESLATFYVALSDDDDADVDETKNNIRLLCHDMPTVFSIGAGPSPKVARLLTAKGKATGETALPQRGEGPSSRGDKVIERYTSRVRGLGYVTKSMFERAKAELGDGATESGLRNWLIAQVGKAPPQAQRELMTQLDAEDVEEEEAPPPPARLPVAPSGPQARPATARRR